LEQLGGDVAIIDALNRAFDVSEWRPWWTRRIIAIGLTIALAVLIIAAVTLLLVGPAAAARVARWVGAEPIVALMWTAIRWPVMIGCVVLAVDPSRWVCRRIYCAPLTGNPNSRRSVRSCSFKMDGSAGSVAAMAVVMRSRVLSTSWSVERTSARSARPVSVRTASKNSDDNVAASP
jgi:hypothetical protein